MPDIFIFILYRYTSGYRVARTWCFFFFLKSIFIPFVSLSFLVISYSKLNWGSSDF